LFVAPLCGLFWLVDSGMRTCTAWLGGTSTSGGTCRPMAAADRPFARGARTSQLSSISA